jgi:hypothetical protein
MTFPANETWKGMRGYTSRPKCSSVHGSSFHKLFPLLGKDWKRDAELAMPQGGRIPKRLDGREPLLTCIRIYKKEKHMVY